MTRLRAAALATCLALAPLTASAVTLDATNTISRSETVVMATGHAWDFSASFRSGDLAASYSFTFVNPYRSKRVIDFGATVREVSARFSGGAQLRFNDVLFLNSLGGAATDSGDGLIPVEAKGRQVLTVSFGAIRPLVRGGVANITFGATVAPVPVPAAGGLLAASLLGLAVLSRRRRAG